MRSSHHRVHAYTGIGKTDAPPARRQTDKAGYAPCGHTAVAAPTIRCRAAGSRCSWPCAEGAGPPCVTCDLTRPIRGGLAQARDRRFRHGGCIGGTLWSARLRSRGGVCARVMAHARGRMALARHQRRQWRREAALDARYDLRRHHLSELAEEQRAVPLMIVHDAPRGLSRRLARGARQLQLRHHLRRRARLGL